MAGLATVIRREKAREGRMRVLVLGLDGAGKSSVVARWRGLDAAAVRQTEPTFGFRIWSVAVPGGRHKSGTQEATPLVTVWDIGGQQSLRAYWRNYFEATDGLVFVVDAAAPGRLVEAASELRALLPSLVGGLSVAVLANKADCADALPTSAVEDAVARVLGDAPRVRAHVFRTSALTGEGVAEALLWLHGDIGVRLGYVRPEPVCLSSIDL